MEGSQWMSFSKVAWESDAIAECEIKQTTGLDREVNPRMEQTVLNFQRMNYV